MKRHKIIWSHSHTVLQSKREGISVVLDALSIPVTFDRPVNDDGVWSQRVTFYPADRHQSVMAQRAIKPFV